MAEGTKQRIVDEAVALFAEQGFKATTVAAIEAAAGLSPGSGALYKHFPSKQAVLVAAVEAQLARLHELDALLAAFPIDVAAGGAGGGTATRDAMAALAGFSLDELDRSRHLQQVILRDAAGVEGAAPGTIDSWVQGTYRGAADQLGRRLSALGIDPAARHLDVEAMAFMAMAPLVLSRIVEWLTGRPPLGLTRERLIAAWVEVQVATERQMAADEPHDPAEPDHHAAARGAEEHP